MEKLVSLREELNQKEKGILQQVKCAGQRCGLVCCSNSMVSGDGNVDSSGGNSGGGDDWGG